MAGNFRSSRLRRAIACAVLCAGPWAAGAGDDTAEMARAVLASYCARCHQSELAGANGPSRFGNSLDLDDLATDTSLVVAGRPDASRLYQRMLGRHAPTDVGQGGDGGDWPAPEEIEAVRDWIEALPIEDGCAGRPPLTAEEVSAARREWLASKEAGVAARTRFLSLGALYVACVPKTRLAMHREAARRLVGALGRDGVGRDDVSLDTVGAAGALLALDLGAAGLTGEAWDDLTREAPAAAAGAVPADWLAARLLAVTRLNAGPVSLRGDVMRDPGIAALAREWEKDVWLPRAAADMGLRRTLLAERLAAVEGEEKGRARRLLQGALPRRDWQRLAAALRGQAGDGKAGEDGAPSEAPAMIDLGLWSEKPRYAAGDELSLAVTTSLACHLTLISIDAKGRAVVISPSDLEPENLIAPGVTVRIPGANAGYRLRLDQAGEETVVAICQRTRRRPEGVRVDYEKERFGLLGDWRTFLRTMGAREAQITAPKSRRSRRKAQAEAPPIDPGGPAIEGRAAITIDVEAKPDP